MTLRRLAARCAAVLAAGALYGFVSADLYLSEGPWLLAGVFLTAVFAAGLGVAAVALVRLVVGLGLRPQLPVRPSERAVAVTFAAVTVAAFPLGLEWTDGSGAHSGVLPLAEALRVNLGLGDAVWVYFDPGSRAQSPLIAP